MTFALSIFLYFVINMIEPRWLVLQHCTYDIDDDSSGLYAFLENNIRCFVCYIFDSLSFLGQENIMLYGIINRMKDSDKCMIYFMEKDYTFGYATFRAGNLMTELTNGKSEYANCTGV